jgi:hypothetical protein
MLIEPVLPVCCGLAVCGLEFEGVLLAETVGLAVAVPLLVAAPPVALILPVVCVKPTVSVFCDVPPASIAVALLWPLLLSAAPVVTKLPLEPPSLALPPVAVPAEAVPLLPVDELLAAPDVLVAVGLAVLPLLFAEPPAPPVTV